MSNSGVGCAEKYIICTCFALHIRVHKFNLQVASYDTSANYWLNHSFVSVFNISANYYPGKTFENRLLQRNSQIFTRH